MQFLLEENADENGFDLYILDEDNGVGVSPLRRQQKELVRDVGRSYSSSHDRVASAKSFINFDLPQLYQIVKVEMVVNR
ncbi:class I adenylate cyclase [Shigella flexneri]